MRAGAELRKLPSHRTLRCATSLPDSNFGPRGDCRGDFLPAGAATQPPKRRLPIFHSRAGMNRTSPAPPRQHASRPSHRSPVRSPPSCQYAACWASRRADPAQPSARPAARCKHGRASGQVHGLHPPARRCGHCDEGPGQDVARGVATYSAFGHGLIGTRRPRAPAGFTASGFQPAIARAHSRACAVSVTPGNSRRSSTAADSSPPRSKAARIAAASASVTTNMPGAWERGRGRTSDGQMTAAGARRCLLARRSCEGIDIRLGWHHASGDQSGG
jgi:hypothetical protein